MGRVQDGRDNAVSMRRRSNQAAIVLIRPADAGKTSQLCILMGCRKWRRRGCAEIATLEVIAQQVSVIVLQLRWDARAPILL